MRKAFSIIAAGFVAIFVLFLAIEVWVEYEPVIHSFFILSCLIFWWVYVKLQDPLDVEGSLRVIYFGFIIVGAPVISGVIAVGYKLDPSIFVVGGYVVGIVISFMLNNWLESKK